MPSLSRWMIGYGLVLIACDVVDSLGLGQIGLEGRTLISGWAGGLLMAAAGLAAAQGRRSLRRTGLYVGIFLPLALGGIFAWHASDLWREARATGSSRHAAMALSLLAAVSLILVAIVVRLRPREGIASRGYAVTIPSPKRSVVATSSSESSVPDKPRRSEAG